MHRRSAALQHTAPGAGALERSNLRGGGTGVRGEGDPEWEDDRGAARLAGAAGAVAASGAGRSARADGSADETPGGVPGGPGGGEGALGDGPDAGPGGN